MPFEPTREMHPLSDDPEELKRMIEALDREKRQIISLVSHDIKAPLNRVFALVQLMHLDDANLTAEQHSFLDKMHLVVADGLALIRNLVDYRSLEYTKIEIIPEDINLSVIVHMVVRNFTSLAAKKKISIEMDVPHELTIRSDHRCLIRAFENLISNAVKFSTEGKKVSIRAKGSEEGVVVIVQDEARGFTKEDLNNLFNKFQKLSAQPTAGESATGLGLFITKAMLENVRGKISCVTEEGIGSTFTIVLPRTIQENSVVS